MKQLTILLLSIFLLTSCSSDDDYFNPVEGTWTSDQGTKIQILTFSKNFIQKLRIQNKATGEFEDPDPLYEVKYTIDKNFIYKEGFNTAQYSIVQREGKTILIFLYTDPDSGEITDSIEYIKQ